MKSPSKLSLEISKLHEKAGRHLYYAVKEEAEAHAIAAQTGNNGDVVAAKLASAKIHRASADRFATEALSLHQTRRKS